MVLPLNREKAVNDVKNGNPYRVIRPDRNNVYVNCDRCGNRRFGISVEPRGAVAQVVEMICAGCGKTFKCEDGWLKGEKHDDTK